MKQQNPLETLLGCNKLVNIYSSIFLCWLMLETPVDQSRLEKNPKISPEGL